MSVVTRGRSQQAAVAAASPGAVSQLGEQLAGLGLADQAAPAAAVAWAVALKPPQSGAVLVVDGAAEGGGAWREEGDGCAWLSSKLLKQGWTGWICYNDEPPDASGIRGGVTFGHCKGVLAWSPTKLGWLVHSMPAWPARFSDRELSAFAPSGIRCGQSFVWLDMRRTPELTRRICDQIRLMGACVYAARVTPDDEARVGFAEDRLGQKLPKPYRLVPPSLIPLGPGLWHLAKDKGWGHGCLRDGRPTDLDFYEDGLARTPPFAGFWHVQSWLNGDVRPFGHTDRCDNILQVRLPDGAPYQTTRDHAKWGVHADRCLVVVGDLNRTQTQAKRGGGGVVVEDERLWRALASLIHQVGAQHPQEPPLASMDDFHADGAAGSGGTADAPSLRAHTPGSGTRSAAAAARPPGGRRGMSTAAALGGGRGGSGAGEASSGSSASTAGASKPCRCQSGCSHGNCRCRRAGQPCSGLCGCGGLCEHTATAAASSRATESGEAGATADTADSSSLRLATGPPAQVEGSEERAAGSSGTSSAAKPCRCGTGCTHGRCGCRRAGRPCTARCGCGGGCGASSAEGDGTASAVASDPEGQAAADGAEAAAEAQPPSPLLPHSSAAAEPAAPAPAPAPLAQLRAAVEEARVQVAQGLSSVLPFVRRGADQRVAAEQAPLVLQAAVPAAAPIATRAERATNGEEGETVKEEEEGKEQRSTEPSHLSSSPAGSGSGEVLSPGSLDGEQPATEHCRCRKGCRDRRCPCRRAGRACTPACGCSSAEAELCSNCAA